MSLTQWPELLAVWGGERARPKLASPQVLLGSDPEVLYVLGEREGAVVLETWSAESGVRISTVSVASCGQLRGERVWRADRDDQVVVAVRGVDRNELAVLDLRTGSLWEEQPVPFTQRVMASSRDARTRVVFDRDRPDRAEVVSPRGALRPEMLQGANVYAVSGDGALVACWNDVTQRVLLFEAPPSLTVLALTDERYDLRSPQMVFSDDRTTLWCVSAGEARCFALPSMIELGRWTGASRAAEIVAIDRSGRAALLDGPIAFAVGHDAPVAPSACAWSAHLGRASPDGTRLAHASGVLGWHDLARDQRVELHAGGHAGEVLAIAVSRDGRRVATSSTDRSIRVCDATSGESGWVLEGDAEGFGALAFAPDGRTLYAVTHGARPRLTAWSLEEGAETTPGLVELPGCRRIEVSADGARLVTALSNGPDAPCTVVDLARFEAGVAFGGGPSVAAFAAKPSGGVRAVMCLPEIQVWELGPSGELTPGVYPAENFSEGCQLGCISPSGRWLLIVEPSAEEANEGYLDARVCDADDALRTRVRHPTTARRPLTAAAMGERRSVIAGSNGVITVLEHVDRRQARLHDVLRTGVTALALSPDEAVLYVGTGNGQVRVYRVGGV